MLSFEIGTQQKIVGLTIFLVLAMVSWVLVVYIASFYYGNVYLPRHGVCKKIKTLI